RADQDDEAEIRNLDRHGLGYFRSTARELLMILVAALEDRHLSGRTDNLVRWPNREEAHRVTVPLGDPLGPRSEFGPRPLEPVVGVTELFGPDVLPRDVVFPVGRGQYHCCGPGELEDGTLERRETGRVEMLDHLHNRGGIEPLQAAVAVDQ